MKYSLEYYNCRWWIHLNGTRIAGPFHSRQVAWDAMQAEMES